MEASRKGPVRPGVAEQPGCASLEQCGVQVQIGGKLAINLQLRPAAVTSSIVVTGESTLLSTESGSISTVMDRRQIAERPLPFGAPFIPPADAAQELKMDTSSFDARLGRSPAAAATVVFKSGTNDLHAARPTQPETRRGRVTTSQMTRRPIWDRDRVLDVG
jgi:hypothetical protein